MSETQTPKGNDRPVTISADLDALTGKHQLSINGAHGGYRLCGPKYSGNSKPVITRELTEGDIQEIRSYCNEAMRNIRRTKRPE